MLDVFQGLFETFMASLTTEQLAAPEIAAHFLTLLIIIANNWKQLKLCLSLCGTQQNVFIHHIHSFCYDGCGAFVFRFGYIVERVELGRRS